MNNIMDDISALLAYALEKGLIKREDAAYSVNRLLPLLGLKHVETGTPGEQYDGDDGLARILQNMLDFAASTGALDPDTQACRDVLDTEIMNCFMPRPSEVIARFNDLAKDSMLAATDYFYQFSKDSNYIRTDRIKKDIAWTCPTGYGDLVITINLSKPEKDPRDIAAQKNAVQSGYPKCAICRENEGFKGGGVYAARATLRVIPVELCGDSWYFQYSPYVYYNEHCIVLSGKHEPMRITAATFRRLLDFTAKFPHYFIGSNADLPIVGGSILTHDHFQGGRYDFPMAKAPSEREFTLRAFPGVAAGVVKWPMSVIRLTADDQDELARACEHVRLAWIAYSDPEAGISAFTGDTPHNTVTPIARRRGEQYEMDIVLRNNRQDGEHPEGIFHPHRKYHHIKRENIGLIEVMGMAIFPPRLRDELDNLTLALEQPENACLIMNREGMAPHRNFYDRLALMIDNQNLPPDELIRREVGLAYAGMLEDAGVFKREERGMAAFGRFIGRL